jgi:hypothetical protein
MSRTVKSEVCVVLALAALGVVGCGRGPASAASGGVAQAIGTDAGGVPSPMPSSPLYDAGIAPLPSAPVPTNVPGVPSPGLPPGTPTSPGTPSQPGLPPIP